jgi:hypothetical protein
LANHGQTTANRVPNILRTKLGPSA